MKWHGVGQSDVGRRRQQNEDSFFVDDDLGLYIVSDGMGGHAAGEVASREAVRTVVRVITEGKDAATTRAEAVALVEEAVQRACRDVYRLARADIRYAGMGCTLTVMWCRKNQIAVGHVGDSRCYLWREGTASQVTSDHTIGAELKKAGMTDVSPSYASTLSRAIGTHQAVQVDAFALGALAGDRYLLCSDGLSNYVSSPEWLGGELTGDALDATVEALITFANEEGGKDNITAVLVGCEAEEHEREQQQVRQVAISGHLRALSSVFLFESLSMGLLSRLLSHCQITRHRDGEVAVNEGDMCASLMVVTSGTFKIVRDGEVLGTLSAGQHTAETTLLKPRAARASLVAEGDGKLLRLGRRSFWKLVKDRPWLGVNLLERLVAFLSGQLDESVSRRDDGDDETTRLSVYQMV